MTRHVDGPASIAHYRIVAKLGQGGMGEVYRATDTRLGRDVAIKVLPANVAEDAARMARFEREAQMLAALNHPNIAAIYGIEQGALIMELVEGDDLKGPLPIDTALNYAGQIAEGLEAAHEKGIIHRDLKPANIKVTPAGQVKILDFGLAKATEESTGGSSATMSPTLSLAMTQAGMILGTAAYMSPEQARGKPVDKRADIWSFGVVLYEMLTGSTLFGGGETVADSLAAVITQEPDWHDLPKDTPPRIRRLIERCLHKDPKRRMRDIGEARLIIDEAEPAPVPVPAALVSGGKQWWVYGAMALGLLALVLAVFLWQATRPVERPMQRFTADLGPDSIPGLRATHAISPDGARIVFPVQRSGGTVMLATRLLDQSKATVLTGTENATVPFFSPDGQWIGFEADQKLKKVSVQGGAPVALCDAPAMRGASWGEDGYIVAALGASISRVPEAGGTPQPLIKTGQQGQIFRRWPQVLPGSEAVLVTASDNSNAWEDANIEVLTLKTGQIKVVQRGGYFGRYLPSGHLIYVHQGTLFAVPFDLKHYEARGIPAPILDDVAGRSTSGGGHLDFSRTGTFAYLSGQTTGVNYQIQWINAAGKKEPLLTHGGLTPRFSPDGKRLAVAANGQIAVYDMERGSLSQLPSQSPGNSWPVWTPDGKHIVYSGTPNRLWWVRSDGSSQPQPIFEVTAGGVFPGSISPDGRSLAFHQAGAAAVRELRILPLDITDPDHPKAGTPELFLAAKGAQVEPAFSPDGHWLAYSSSESGTYQVFVRQYPEGAKGGGQVQISTTGGRFPIWSRTARELFYVTNDGHIMVVPYTVTGQSFQPGKPRLWAEPAISMTGNAQPLDLAPDGKRFAVLQSDSLGADKGNLHVTFLLNFFDELKRRMPPRAK